ncbi:MAG: DUF4249 domain-containing protein, partial [Cyclobacteriaceae bacterium]
IGQFNNQVVEEADVSISDLEGTREILTEQSPGVYQTTSSNFIGREGNTYVLHIRLPDGTEYKSLPEKLHATPPIDRIHYELKEGIEYLGDFTVNTFTYFQMYVDLTDPPGQENFYRWESTRIMEFESDLPTYPPEIDPPPDPPECCYLCYLYNYDQNNIAIASDRFADGQEMKNIPITRVGNGYENIFSFRLRQYSLTARAYEFFNRIKSQQENTGSIFDTPPGSIRGNIVNINDSREQVLGYFNASAVARKTIVVPRFRYAASGRIKFEYVGDCREVDGAVAEIPEEFENIDFEREGEE